MSLLPHGGSWRLRYRDAIGFNHPLIACVAGGGAPAPGSAHQISTNYLRLEPANLILTAMKKSEGSDFVTIRFYEAEGTTCTARVRMPKSIREAWKTNLIEENEEAIKPDEDGTLGLTIKPYEIVTVKVSV
jgi:alpha-mannosidase